MRFTCLLAAIASSGCAFASVDSQSLDGIWEFSRNGGAFRPVEVPHDWSIAEAFNPKANGHTGKLPWSGKGAYRRTFSVDRAALETVAAGGRAYLEFDGVMARPEVKLNGRAAGGWDYGYMGFVLDVTDKLRAGENLVEVSADTTTTFPRWYVGGGIIRPVTLKVVSKDSPRPHSLYVTTPEVARERATVAYRYVTAGGEEKSGSFVVDKPRLWDVDDPYLYETEIAGEKVRYGIRKIAWTVDDGFHLNGRRVQLKGVCLHYDFGPLGAAFNRAAAKRQLLAMKDMGANAVRTSHNVQAAGFLDLCDELGLLVYNECFDRWNGTIARRSDEPLEPYVERNLKSWIERDRNHPSVICWSMANELTPTKRADGSAWNADGVSAERVKRFRDVIRSLDATRPVTVSHNFGVEWGCVDATDLNDGHYGGSYRTSKKRHPDRPTVYSESASAVSSYGFYQFPAPISKGDYAVAERECDGYDRTAAASFAENEFDHLARDRYCAGEFVWTGIDYLGEPTPYLMWQANPTAPWNYQWKRERNKDTELSQEELSRSSYFGACDLTCIPKDRFYLYRAHWNDRAHTCHVLPHWNWGAARGVTNLPVVVYSDGDAAEIFVNGRSLGRRQKVNYRFTWKDVRWEPGELKAVAYKGGEKIAEDVVRTCGAPAAVKLSRDPYSNGALEFVQVDVMDARGVRDPWATNRVSFAVSGPGRILAVGNGSAHSYESFGDVSGHSLFYGKALVILRRDRGSAASVTLTASAAGLAPATFQLGR